MLGYSQRKTKYVTTSAIASKESEWKKPSFSLSKINFVADKKGQLIELLTRTENLGDDVGKCVMNTDIGEYLIEVCVFIYFFQNGNILNFSDYFLLLMYSKQE